MQCYLLRFTLRLALVLFVALSITTSASRAEVINIEIDPRDPPDPVYVDDDGVFSTTGGTFWNHLGLDFLNDVSKNDLLNEFGQPTDVDVTFDAVGSFDANFRPIELYAGGGTGFIEIKSLDPTRTYDLALYAANPVLAISTTDAGGSSSQFATGIFTIELPGDEGEEYLLFNNLVPFDLGGGVMGITVEILGATPLAGLQLSSIPEPSAAALLLAGGITLLLRRN